MIKQKYKVFEKTTNNRHIAYKRTKGVFFLITRLEPKMESVDEANTYLYNKMLGLNNGRCLSNKTTKNLAHFICALYNYCDSIQKNITDLRSIDIKEKIASLIGKNTPTYLNNKISCWMDYLEWYYQIHNLDEFAFFEDQYDVQEIHASKEIEKKFIKNLRRYATFKKQKDAFLIKKTELPTKCKGLTNQELDQLLKQIKNKDPMKWGVIYFMYKSGCRISEALELKLDEDFTKALLVDDSKLVDYSYLSKGQKTWGIPYTKQIEANVFSTLAKELSAIRKKRLKSKKSQYFFINMHGKPMTYKNIQSMLVSFNTISHALRYTYAIECRKKLINERKTNGPRLVRAHELLKNQLGHKNLETTIKYCYSGEPV